MTEAKQCIRVLADPVHIEQCRQKVETNATAFEKLSQVLALAGNETRLKMMYLLEEEGQLCPCDIADILDMSAPAVSQHLRKLKDAGVIKSKRIGQTIFYSLHQEHLKILHPLFRYVNEFDKKEPVS